MWWIAAGASAATLILLIRLILLRTELKKMSDELARTREPGYNRLVRIHTSDKRAEKLAAEINLCIEEQKKLKYDAQQAERSIRRAMSDIAHDLRTPLAVIKGDLQLISAGGELSEKDSGYLEVCMQKTEQLTRMTNDFFELAVLESSTGLVPLSRIDLTSALMVFIAENEGRIRLAGIEPEIVFPPRTVFVMADGQMLGRMLDNLLGNVLKYSCGDFLVTVSDKGGGSIAFENPAGKELTDPSRLFERSYRAGSSRSNGGAGLGLYIVKLLAEKQGASVSAELNGGMLRIEIKFAENV